MNLYDVSVQSGSALPIFATDFDQAASIFTAWHLGHRETPVPDFEVKQRNPRWPGINTDHLLAALERGLAGVGRYDARIGWSIRSPLDEEYA